MKDFFETVFSEMEKNTEVFRQHVELQRGIFRRYQEQLKSEMNRDPLNDLMAEFSRTMMATVLDVAAFQRESRKRFLEMQASIAEAYLDLLDKMENGYDNGSDEREKGRQTRPDAE